MSRYSMMIDNSTPEHTYLNITIPHDDSTPEKVTLPSLAQYTDNRTLDIIDKPENYYLSVVRWSCPIDEIPIDIMVPMIDSVPSTINPPLQNNPNKLKLSFTLQYNNNNLQTYVEWIPQSFYNPDGNSTYYYLKSYQHLIDLMNTALAGVYYANIQAGRPLNGSPPQVAGARAPFFVLNNDNRISLIAHRSFDEKYVGGATVKIFMNSFTWEYFRPAFNVNYNNPNALNGLNYQFIIANTGNNNVSNTNSPSVLNPPAWSATVSYDTGDIVLSGGNLYYCLVPNINLVPPSVGNWLQYTIPASGALTAGEYIEVKQEYETISNWNILKSIVLTTSSIPVITENIRSNNGSGVAIGRPILTDFEPLSAIPKGTLTYVPSGPYRMTNMVGNTPLRKTDLQVYWTDKFQRFYPLYVPPHLAVTVKLMMRKKSYTGS